MWGGGAGPRSDVQEEGIGHRFDVQRGTLPHNLFHDALDVTDPPDHWRTVQTCSFEDLTPPKSDIETDALMVSK